MSVTNQLIFELGLSRRKLLFYRKTSRLSKLFLEVRHIVYRNVTLVLVSTATSRWHHDLLRDYPQTAAQGR